MKIAALTMVHKDYWALSQWYRHHGTQLGHRHLYIVAHGHDPEISRLCPDASIITVPRDRFDAFDRKRGDMLNAFQAGLLQSYDWVMRTDADELICWDPDRYHGLADVLSGTDVPVVTALGFDLVEQPGDAPMAQNVFTVRSNAAFSGHYSKAFAARRSVSFVLHGTKVTEKRLQSFPFTMPPGLYLAHLKFANLQALQKANQTRKEVANSNHTGLPGAGWSDADRDSERFLDTFAAKQKIAWGKAEVKAYKALSQRPSRNERHRVVKTRALKFDFRTELPDWFSDL